MKEILTGMGIAIAAALFILVVATKVVPMLEDLRVVEPKPGIECAIVNRIAHTSIDCWKVEKEKPYLTFSKREDGRSMEEDLFINHIASPHPADATTVKIEPIYNQEPLHIFIDDTPTPEAHGSFTVSNTDSLYFKNNDSSLTIKANKHSAISVSCGKGTIEVDYDTGEATFNNGCDPSKASKALWEGIKPFFNMETRAETRMGN